MPRKVTKRADSSNTGMFKTVTKDEKREEYVRNYMWIYTPTEFMKF
jgi:hypothetical protein